MLLVGEEGKKNRGRPRLEVKGISSAERRLQNRHLRVGEKRSKLKKEYIRPIHSCVLSSNKYKYLHYFGIIVKIFSINVK